MIKTPLAPFLAGNPFACPRTLGFFYREKMRAIHRVAPEHVPSVRSSKPRILEVGGGRSGMAAKLYPDAQVVTIDLDPSHGLAACNRGPSTRFVAADAICLPFGDASFDLVTMFDLLEHVPDDHGAVAEAVRVLRPGGYLLVSTPRENWRYPYFRVLAPICPHERELFDEWGHVRRGYSPDDLRALIPMPDRHWSGFISAATALNHDISFSRLPKSARFAVCLLLSPLTWIGYWRHAADHEGTETASAWQKA